jgi:hypothetical protein
VAPALLQMLSDASGSRQPSGSNQIHISCKASIESSIPANSPKRDLECAWSETTAAIAALIDNHHLNIADVFRVGSSVAREDLPASTSTDTDSLIILSDSIPVSRLRQLRTILDDALLALRQPQYHYKLLAKNELPEFATYDGFRYFEFSESHVAFLGTDLLRRNRPQLNEESFRNSMLIQSVYLAHTRGALGPRSREDMLMARASRNLSILQRGVRPTREDVKAALRALARRDSLLTYGLNLSITRHRDLNSFPLDEYFVRLPHEFVNKYTSYSNARMIASPTRAHPARIQ